MLLVIENVLSADLLAKMQKSLAGADWKDGAMTAGAVSASVKRNLQLDEKDPLAIEFGAAIIRAISAQPLFLSAALPEKIYPPKFNKYEDGGTYGVHVDSAIMRVDDLNLTIRTDLSATVFLNSPEDYDGGELEIETEFGAQRIKLTPGDMVLYPSTSLHQVTPVTRGARIASFFWVQSMVREAERRELLFDLDQAIQELADDLLPQDPRFVSLTGVYNNLIRQWASV